MRPSGIFTACFASALVFGVLTLPSAHAQQTPGPAVSKGVVATVAAINPNNGMATLKIESGETYELRKGASWKVGDKVECQLLEEGPPATLQDCQPWSK